MCKLALQLCCCAACTHHDQHDRVEDVFRLLLLQLVFHSYRQYFLVHFLLRYSRDLLTCRIKVYFFFPEPNGWKLETLDAIFNEAHKKGENPVFTEKRWRKNGWQKASDAQSQDEEQRGQSNDGERSEEKSADNTEHKEGRAERKEES